MKKKQIIIFGTGRGGILIKRMLESFGCEVIGFADNSVAKQGMKVEELKVYAPAALVDMECEIVIASVWEGAIYQQLQEMGIANKVVGKEQYAYEYMCNATERYQYIGECLVEDQKPLTYIFGLDLGLFFGGVESWAYVIGDQLRKMGIPFKFVTTQTSLPAPNRFQEDTYYLDLDGKDYIKGLDSVIGVLQQHAPCVVIDSWQNVTMLAAGIVKRHNFDMIRCNISVLHNNLPRTFQSVQQFDETIDYCMGVSRDINEKLVSLYGIAKSKIRYKESPVKFLDMSKEYSVDEKNPLRIGYAARLIKALKRADLLIPLVKELAERGVNFLMEIAGVGDLSQDIEREIKENHLQGKVKLVGLIERSKMNEFWNRQDVFVNLSESEGVGLSMLEAMGNGCVPVVTRVAGSVEFVKSDMGYICEQGDIKYMADVIQELSDNRSKLVDMGMQSRECVRYRCNPEMYVNHIMNLVKGESDS